MKNDKRYIYFSSCYNFFSSNQVLLLIFSGLEYIILLVEIVKTLFSFWNISQHSLEKFSLLFHIRNLTNKDSRDFSYIPPLVIIFFIFLYFFCFYLQGKLNNPYFNNICVNFYEIFFLRFFSIFFFDILNNGIISFINKPFDKFRFLALLMYIGITLAYFFTCLTHFTRYFIFIPFSKKNRFPFDFITKDSDIFLLTIKFLTSYQSNIHYFYQKADAKIQKEFFGVGIFTVILSEFLYYFYRFSRNRYFLKNNQTFHILRFSFSLCHFWVLFYSISLRFDKNLYIILVSSSIIFTICSICITKSSLNEVSYNDRLYELEEMFYLLFIREDKNMLKAYIEKIQKHINSSRVKCDFCNLLSQKTQNAQPKKSILGQAKLSAEIEEMNFVMYRDKLKQTETEYNEDFELIDNYFETFLQIYKQNHLKKPYGYTIQYIIYDILFNFYKAIYKKRRNFAVLMHLSALIRKYQVVSIAAAINLELLYQIFFEQKNENEMRLLNEIKSFVQMTEKVNNVLETLITHVKSNINLPMKFLKLGYQVRKIKNRSEVKFLLDKSRANTYTAQLLIYLIEEIINSPLNQEKGMIKEDVTMNEEFLEMNFIQNKNIIILYDHKTTTATVKKIGKDMISLLNLNLLNYIPKELKSEGIERFQESLNSEELVKKFDFLLEETKEEPSKEIEKEIVIDKVVKFEMIFKILYEDLTRKVYLIGEYALNKGEVLVTKIQKDTFCEDILLNESNRFFELNNCLEISEGSPRDSKFGGTVIGSQRYSTKHAKRLSSCQPLSSLNSSKRYNCKVKSRFNNRKNFEFIYASNLRDLQIEEDVVEKGKKKYEKSFEKKRIKLISYFNKNEDKITLKHSKRSVELKLKEIIDNGGIYLYNFYLSTKDVKNRLKGKLSTQTNLQLFETQVLNTKQIEFDIKDSSSICNSLSSQVSMQSKLHREKKYQNLTTQQQYIKYKKRFDSIIKMTSIFCIFMIVFALVSLILELHLNNRLLDSYNIYTELRAVNRLFYNTITSILAVVCVGSPTSEGCINYYREYMKKYNQNFRVNYPSFDFSVYENELKVENFGNQLSSLKLSLFRLADRETDELFNSDFQYNYVSITERETKILYQKSTFENALQIILNSMIVITETEEYLNKPVYIFTATTHDFSNVKKKDDLKSWQVEYYNTVMNYEKFLDNFVNIQITLSRVTLRKFKQLHKVVIVCLILILLFHFVCFFLVYSFLISFEHLLKINTNKIMSKLTDEKFRYFFLKKYEYLLTLSLFYSKSPNSIFNELATLQSSYLSRKKKGSSSAEQNAQKDQKSCKENINYFPLKSYREITKLFYNYILLFCVYCLVVSVIFFFLWINSFEKINLVFNIITDNTVAACSGYNIFALEQIMILSNQTEKDISESILGYEGDDYLQYESFRSIELISSLDHLRKKVGSLIQTTNDFIDLDCDTFLNVINDSKFIAINDRHPEKGFFKNYPEFCKSFHIMEYKDDLIFYKTVFYEINKVLQGITDRSYDGYLKVLKEGRIFFLSDIQFLLYRPFRTWYNDNVYQSAINKSISLEKTILFSILSILIVSEVLIFFILYFKFFAKLKRIHYIFTGIKNVFRVLK